MNNTRRLTSRETADWLRERDNFLILTHTRPDGDTLGSAAGLCSGLRNLGKTAYVLENPETTERYLDYVAPYLAPPGFAPDFILAVDTADAAILAKNAGDYRDRVDLAIDHHPSYTGYAKYACLEADRAACGEVVYHVLMELSGAISAETALPLYVALSTDTGCFAYANTTWETFQTAGELLKAGADHRAVNKKLFRTKTRARMALDGELYTSLQYAYEGRVAVAVVTQELLNRTGATENDLDDVAAIPGQVEGVSVGITVKEQTDGKCKVSVRTSPGVDANMICQKFGGGGHVMAGGCTIDASPEETVAALLVAVGEVLS